MGKINKTADLLGWLSGSLCRFYCHWQRTPVVSAIFPIIASEFVRIKLKRIHKFNKEAHHQEGGYSWWLWETNTIS